MCSRKEPLSPPFEYSLFRLSIFKSELFCQSTCSIFWVSSKFWWLFWSLRLVIDWKLTELHSYPIGFYGRDSYCTTLFETGESWILSPIPRGYGTSLFSSVPNPMPWGFLGERFMVYDQGAKVLEMGLGDKLYLLGTLLSCCGLVDPWKSVGWFFLAVERAIRIWGCSSSNFYEEKIFPSFYPTRGVLCWKKTVCLRSSDS